MSSKQLLILRLMIRTRKEQKKGTGSITNSPKPNQDLQRLSEVILTQWAIVSGHVFVSKISKDDSQVLSYTKIKA